MKDSNATEWIQLRVTQEQKARFKKAASKQGLTQWMLEAAEEKLSKGKDTNK